MKSIKILSIALLMATMSCNDGYIDDISTVDPGPDVDAPEATIKYPNGDVTIPFTESETDIEFSFAGSDDIELQSITISLDGSQLETYSEFIDYRNLDEVFSVEGVSTGEHTFNVDVTDISGKTTTESITFEVTNKYIAKTGEIFYMPFEGNTYLDLISETEATTGGSPGFGVGLKNGKAASFSASTMSYLLFPGDAFSQVESYTLSFWVNATFVDDDENGSNDGVLGLVGLSNVSQFWGNLDFFVENNSNPTDGADMRIHTRNDDSETWITNVNDFAGFFGQWSHHVLSYNGATKEFNYYINGVLATTTTAGWDDALTFTESGPMVMGCVQFQTDPSLTSATGAQGWASYLTGRLDEVRLFNIALSEQGVTDLYNSEKP